MKRLLVFVEGETEEAFVRSVLMPHLVERGWHSVDARIFGNARQRDRRGGIRPWPSARSDILRHLRSDPSCLVSTMVDYYGLPAQGSGGWPGRSHAQAVADVIGKATAVESSLRDEIHAEMGWGSGGLGRFLPFVVMHEFEGLLFSDCDSFANSLGKPQVATLLSEVNQLFATPEHINDSPSTAPSKRILRIVPGYQKPLNGTIAASSIGLGVIRAACPHFGQWLSSLEAAIA